MEVKREKGQRTTAILDLHIFITHIPCQVYLSFFSVRSIFAVRMRCTVYSCSCERVQGEKNGEFRVRRVHQIHQIHQIHHKSHHQNKMPQSQSFKAILLLFICLISIISRYHVLYPSCSGAPSTCQCNLIFQSQSLISTTSLRNATRPNPHTLLPQLQLSSQPHM